MMVVRADGFGSRLVFAGDLRWVEGGPDRAGITAPGATQFQMINDAGRDRFRN
jgi:hypothetical protein